MTQNFFKIAFRNIKRYSKYSILNITGMAIGMASAILILLWVQAEWSYDRHFKNADDLYRVLENQPVSGAKSFEIFFLLSKEYIIWVLISILIASPVAWYIMHKWLQRFAYRIDIRLWVFALTGSIALVVALLTVGFHSYRAANKNPVEALRYE